MNFLEKLFKDQEFREKREQIAKTPLFEANASMKVDYENRKEVKVEDMLTAYHSAEIMNEYFESMGQPKVFNNL